MSSVAKQRIAIVVVTALLLCAEFTVARASAAIVGVVFYCWLVGRNGVHRDDPKRAQARVDG